jgi:hypothetical protein
LPGSGGGGDDDLPPHDHVGCLLAAVRAGCGMALIQVLMAIAILLVALISFFFFR